MRRVAAPDAPARVVTFDSHHDDPGTDRLGFGEAFFASEGIGAIHVLTAANDWFQCPDTPAALAAVRAAANAPLLAYGSSMGGYGAVRFAAAAGADRVLALSPQYSIDRRKVDFETRWKEEARRIRFRPELDGPIAGVVPSVVAYDPLLDEDRCHVDRIAGDVAIERLRVPHGGHNSAAFLSDLGLLKPLVHAMLDGNLDLPAVAGEAHRRRKESPTWLGELAGRQPAHRLGTAIGLAERAAKLGPDSPVALNQLALRLREAGELDRAITIHRTVVAMAPLPAYLWGLSKTLAAAGQTGEALAAAAEIQRQAASVAGYHRWAAELRMQLHDRAGAIADLRRAVEALPSHRGYRWTLVRERLLQALGL
ncbi:tetratricopeptide repeat protein [Sphingomonas nostoxanthinifaciens]|uniref:hypothetical protein n=1 Tax=Sphingomonas nostoxanthinifaciens TaxID=2872652 RepID=UPI001CC1D179|nr:hypothetical protein [Sphingomonas nostoxanthinifaciens]UAK25352.1 hypothetical protein K8P63_03965 [Sphingomonas nostoxanthinifaciens]